MTSIAFSPNVGPVKFDCVVSERHTSEIEITGNPIETGSEVNDHAYIKPKEVVLDVADANAALTYNALVLFQESRVPFYMVTGLTLYRNMLIRSIDVTRDKTNHNILRATVTLREVIIVSTGTAPASEPKTGSKSQPGGAKSRGAASPSTELAGDAQTANRAAGTVTRGDLPTQSVSTEKTGSLLKEVFG